LILNHVSEAKKVASSALKPPQSILVVDDDPNVVKSFKMILESAGFTVDTLNTAIDAMRKASRIHFDLIIVDMKLPDTLGDELADRLHSTNPKVKILMVTGYSNYMKQLEGNRATYDVLMKPINPEELVETAKRLTQNKIEKLLFINQVCVVVRVIAKVDWVGFTTFARAFVDAPELCSELGQYFAFVFGWGP
jgi:DNA-binding response OmpR family regulator